MLVVPSKQRVIERLLARVDQVDGCWLWPGATNPGGYGLIESAGRQLMAHRVAYEHLVGPIPAGLQIDHRCHNGDLSCPGGRICQHRRCVNPLHLEPVTNLTNTTRARARTNDVQVDRCRRGHELSGHNEQMTRRGRRCRACQRMNQASYQRRIATS